MKRIDIDTQRKLYWLFIPLAVVVALEMIYLWFDLNLLDLWFGWKIDILSWCNPALIVSTLIVFVGYSIAAIKQKCWGEFSIALVMLILMLLNMSNLLISQFIGR